MSKLSSFLILVSHSLCAFSWHERRQKKRWWWELNESVTSQKDIYTALSRLSPSCLAWLSSLKSFHESILIPSPSLRWWELSSRVNLHFMTCYYEIGVIKGYTGIIRNITSCSAGRCEMTDSRAGLLLDVQWKPNECVCVIHNEETYVWRYY
jgi:hypothetical protein